MVSTLEYRFLYTPVGSKANPQVTRDSAAGDTVQGEKKTPATIEGITFWQKICLGDGYLLDRGIAQYR